MRRYLLYLIASICALLLIVHQSPPVALAADPFAAEPVRYAIMTLAEPGGRVLFYFEVKNSGTSTWTPGSVMLDNVSNPLGAATRYNLSRNVLPNETAYWDFEVSAPTLPAVHESTWQITHNGAAISPRLTCYVIAVPKQARELRAKIQTLIDEFNREHGHEVQQVVRLIRELIAREGKGIIEKLIETRCGLLSGILTLCAVALVARRSALP